jgi:sporulation protein YlmC with PRC-barrel domain
MLKPIALSACVLILGGGLALAEQNIAPAGQGQTGRSVATEPSSLSTKSWLASDIYKQPVYDQSENKIGDVTDLELDSTGNIRRAVIGVGGFLGVGEKEVAVPFADLKVASRDGKSWLMLDRSKDQLKNEPAYHRESKKNLMK